MPKLVSFKGYDVGKVSSWALKSAELIGDAEQGLIYWVSEAGGGVLSRKLAVEIAMYIRGRVADQSAFAGTPPLSEDWAERKERLGLDERKGIATGSLMNAITVLKSGSGYSVGISSKERTSKFIVGRDGRKQKIGSISEVEEYAYYLEFGRSGGGQFQPARPWFYPSFNKYLEERFPEVIHSTLKRDFESKLKKFAYLSGTIWDDVEPSEYYTKYGRVK